MIIISEDRIGFHLYGNTNLVIRLYRYLHLKSIYSKMKFVCISNADIIIKALEKSLF